MCYYEGFIVFLTNEKYTVSIGVDQSLSNSDFY